MSNAAPQHYDLAVGDSATVSVDFSGYLDEGVTLSGTPAISEAKGHLTFTAPQVTTAQKTINDKAVAAGLAVQFKVDMDGAEIDRLYKVKVRCVTSTGNTRTGFVFINCNA